MNMQRILAIVLIYLFAAAGWQLLGYSTSARSENASRALGASVEHLWGTPLHQESPTFSVDVPGTEEQRWVMPEANQVEVSLRTDYRKKGLMWYSTYVCGFEAKYRIRNDDNAAQKIRLAFRFPSPSNTYDNFTAFVNERELSGEVNTQEGVRELVELAPEESLEFRVSYETRGLSEWHYKLDPNLGRVRGLDLRVTTNFDDVDFAEGSLSPMKMEVAPEEGRLLTWTAQDLITRQSIGVVVPEKLNPGPLTARIIYFAPVCLLFFFVLVATIGIVYLVDIHPMHYLFIAAGFFAFHLLLAYLAGLVNIHVAFVISAATAIGLVTSYLYAALKREFPWKIAIAGELFFLVMFSYSFFFEGITGLTVAVGSVITLAILMAATAKLDWNGVFEGQIPKKRTPNPPVLPTASE
jgi:hypothetical protein